MARVELVRGYDFGEESDSPVEGRIVVSESEEPASLADRSQAIVQFWAGLRRYLASRRPELLVSSGDRASAEFLPRIDPQVGKAALLVSGDDEEELRAIKALVVLLQGRLDAGRAAEMERLIDVAMPVVSGRPHPALLDQARRNADFRADFLERYDTLDAAQVHDLFGSKADNSAALAGRWRSGGKIFGVEHRGRILYPAFQFDDTGRPKPVVARVLQALGKRGSWQVASWFTAPNGWLPDDRRPVDVMDADPDAVADAAREATRSNLF